MHTDGSLAALFRAEVSTVFGYFVLRCGSRQLAEDLTSQTFMAASEHFAKGRGSEVTPAWLQTVASRRLIDHWRSSGAQRRRFDRLRALRSEERGPAPPEPHADVLAALDALPERQRAVLVLRYLEEFSVREVAEALEITYKAAESLLGRARLSFIDAYEAVQRD